MNYRIPEELKDAGFPFLVSDAEPSLARLIEVCGHGFYQLEKIPFRHWVARGTNDGSVYREVKGETPEEAVAQLWLLLHRHHPDTNSPNC